MVAIMRALILRFLKRVRNPEFIFSLGNLKLGKFQDSRVTYKILNKEEESKESATDAEKRASCKNIKEYDGKGDLNLPEGTGIVSDTWNQN